MIQKKKILLLDDHKIIRDGLKLILSNYDEYEVFDTDSGREAVHIVSKNRIDLIISDISMDIMDGIQFCQELKKNRFNHKILIFSMNKEIDTIRQLLEIGINGYIFKDSGKQVFLAGINQILNGEYYFSSEVATKMTLLHAGLREQSNNIVQLTEREKEVLKLIANEYTNKEISESLFISVRTVDSHRRNLIEKIGAKNTAGLVRYAFNHKIAV